MQAHTFYYQRDTGFSVPGLPALDSPSTLVLTFGAKDLGAQPEPLAALTAAYPQSCHLGCSTAGEIHGTALRDGSLSVAVVRFSHTRLRLASSQVRGPEDSLTTGEALARALTAPDLRGVFVLSDGLHLDGGQLVRGLNKGLPPGVVLTGGLSANGDRFHSSWVLGRAPGSATPPRPPQGPPQGPAARLVAAVGLYGDHVRIGHSARAGREPDGLVEGAGEAGEESVRAHDDLVLALAISCVRRRQLLGRRTEEEIEAAYNSLPLGSQMVGFYASGQIGPQGSRSALHHHTWSMTTLSEG